MSVGTTEIWQVFEGLQDLAAGKDRTDCISEPLEGRMTINGAVCWPKSTINAVIRASLDFAPDVHKVFRMLVNEKLVRGPLRTSRMEDGHKVNYEMYFVSVQALAKWEYKNAASMPE